MTEYQNDQSSYNLATRTRQFAKDCRGILRALSKSRFLTSDIDQLLRSSASVAANYLEADEALSKKDFAMRIKICRKEARESMLWLDLLTDNADSEHTKELRRLFDEAYQLVKIFNAIVSKSS